MADNDHEHPVQVKLDLRSIDVTSQFAPAGDVIHGQGLRPCEFSVIAADPVETGVQSQNTLQGRGRNAIGPGTEHTVIVLIGVGDVLDSLVVIIGVGDVRDSIVVIIGVIWVWNAVIVEVVIVPRGRSIPRVYVVSDTVVVRVRCLVEGDDGVRQTVSGHILESRSKHGKGHDYSDDNSRDDQDTATGRLRNRSHSQVDVPGHYIKVTGALCRTATDYAPTSPTITFSATRRRTRVVPRA